MISPISKLYCEGIIQLILKKKVLLKIRSKFSSVIGDRSVISVTCASSGSVATRRFLSTKLIGFPAGMRKAQENKMEKKNLSHLDPTRICIDWHMSILMQPFLYPQTILKLQGNNCRLAQWLLDSDVSQTST